GHVAGFGHQSRRPAAPGLHRRSRDQARPAVLRHRGPDLPAAGHHLVLWHQRHRTRRRQTGVRPMSAVANVSVDVERPPPPPRGWPRQRVIGYALVGLWIVAGLGLVAYLALSWNFEFIAKYAPAYLSGVGVTLTLTVVSVLFGAVLSIPIAYARMSRS